MDIEVLRNFVEIIESGSITAAAKKLYTAQATLSMQLKSLEKELGTVLLIRTAHRLELTEAGKMLYRRAKSISAIDSRIRSEIKEMEKGGEGTVRIGISSDEGFSLCGDISADFARIYPKIRLEVYERPDCEILSMTEDGALSAAFVRTPCTVSADMRVISFEDEPMAAIYHADYFSLESEPLRISKLSGKKLAVQRKYGRLFENVFSDRLKESPVVSFAADNAGSVVLAAERGLGIGILPLSAASRGRGVKLRTIDEPRFRTQRIIVSKKNAYACAAERRFLEYAETVLNLKD